jgi:23S rRNA pseudouridine2605 synthase
MPPERLQKVLAAAGLGSRRSCEVLIDEGRVSIDGQAVTQPGTKVDVDTQEIRCDGEIVRVQGKVYYLVNKPKGVVCSNDDERGRPMVVSMLPHRSERLFTVGRLDSNTEGLLIVTNDGSFTQHIAHPRNGITKTYHARVIGKIPMAAIKELMEGIWIAGYKCRAAEARVLFSKSRESIVELVMQEGRKREIRRMLAKVGHKVLHLERVRIGDLADPDLKPGQWRKLTSEEVKSLLNFKASKKRAKRSRRSTSESPKTGQSGRGGKRR